MQNTDLYFFDIFYYMRWADFLLYAQGQSFIICAWPPGILIKNAWYIYIYIYKDVCGHASRETEREMYSYICGISSDSMEWGTQRVFDLLPRVLFQRVGFGVIRKNTGNTGHGNFVFEKIRVKTTSLYVIFDIYIYKYIYIYIYITIYIYIYIDIYIYIYTYIYVYADVCVYIYIYI